jgi:Flp pilus assembly protein TadD
MEPTCVAPRGSLAPLRRACEAQTREELAEVCEDLDRFVASTPGDLEARLYAAWVRGRMLVSPGPTHREELEELARAALGGHCSLALPLCVLGHAALRRGELHGARRLLRRAVDADPTLLDARRGLAIVQRRLGRPRRPVGMLGYLGLI